MKRQAHGESVQFADVQVIRDTGLAWAVPHRRQAGGGATAPQPGWKRRLVAWSAPRHGRHPQDACDQPGAGVTSMDRYSPLREKMIGLRGGGLLLMGILVAPLAIAGYVGLTVLLFLPLLGLRRMFPRRSTSSVCRWDGNAPVFSGVGNLSDAPRSA